MDCCSPSNFVILGNAVFQAFTNVNYPLVLSAHVIFGHLLAVAFYSAGVRRNEPVFRPATAVPRSQR